MQLMPILIVAAVALADGGLHLVGRGADRPGVAALVAVGGPLVAVAVAALYCRWCQRRLGGGPSGPGDPRALGAARGAVRAGHVAVLLAHAAALLGLGWLETVRRTTGNLVAVDEVLAMLPALAGVIGVWAAYAGVERRLRQSLFVRQLDVGAPVYAPLSRRGFVWQQVRTHLLLLLVPLVLILIVGESVRRLVPPAPPTAAVGWADVLALVGALGVFLVAPLIARVVLDVRPLPAGPQRDDLLAVCQAHGVRVRDVLLWNTSGTMANAAVMGFIAPVRYVLLTDALLDAMDPPRLRAVMAHEVAHVRRRHMPWMIGALLGATLVLSLVSLPLFWARETLPAWVFDPDGAFQIGLVVAQLAGALLLFGWVSRRFERQADTFAVQHLSRAAPDEPDGGDRVRPEAIAAMCGALETIARRHAIDRRRRSWRHGSIAWRQTYLATLLGQPLGGLAIDRTVRRVKAATAVALLLGGGLIAWAEGLFGGGLS